MINYLFCLTLPLAFLCTGAKETPPTVSDYITKAAEIEGVPPDLLRAICWVESENDVWAYAHNDGGKGNSAFGACQILYKTARGLGLGEYTGCKVDFRENSKVVVPKSAILCPLFDIKESAKYAAKYLKLKLEEYEDPEEATAAYNTGTKKLCTKGWLFDKNGKRVTPCVVGDLVNRYYVRKVFKAMAEGR